MSDRAMTGNCTVFKGEVRVKLLGPKADPSDPRVKLTVVVWNIGWVLLLASFVWRVREGRSGPQAAWLALLSIAALFLMAICEARMAILLRSAFRAVNVPLAMVMAFGAATGRSDEFDPPVWLSVIAVSALVLAVGVAIPFAAYVVSRSQDERERRIVMTAMSVAFMVTIVIVGTFVLLEEFTTIQSPTLPWVLLAGVASWLGSFFVLRERM